MASISSELNFASMEVVPIEFPVQIHPDGSTGPFSACMRCIDVWHFDLIVTHPSDPLGRIWLREWHASDCTRLLAMETLREENGW